jgi:uncharacterized protein (DUF1800 family)
MRTFPGFALWLAAFGWFVAPPLSSAKNAPLPVVTIVASVGVTDETAAKPGSVVVTREGDLAAPLTVNLEVTGSAKPGVDYQDIPGNVTIPASQTSAAVMIVPISRPDRTPSLNVVLTLKPDPNYLNGQADTATVRIDGSPPHLFVALLRPTDGAPESTAYGTATLVLAPDRTNAKVTVSHANLTSPLVTAHLKLGDPGTDGSYLIGIPPGQDVSFEWDLQPTGQFTVEALQTALDRGQIYVAMDTKNHPTGELRGSFIHATGSETFRPPPPPPKPPTAPVEAKDVARFLIQATFGPKKSEIDDFLHPPTPPNQPPRATKTFDSWIDEQIATPPSSHLEAMREDFRAFMPTGPNPRINNGNRQNAWWRMTIEAPDQLRQRVAFALSEIFVISDTNDAISNNSEGAASFYDLLARDAFGNFRQLLEDVTLHPAMGAYLSMLKSAKADEKRGTSADENYAREVMQLFTIGLNELQPDGSYRLSGDGRPIPTYDQATVVETAKVFTGWGFYSPEPGPSFGGARANFFQPMMLYPAQHDDGPKTIVGGVKIPAKAGGTADLRMALDALFDHPNVGPFISRRLIQRLVTSNPSPGYVYRVSEVFARNSQGERGDLGAVIRAILLDWEARSPDVANDFGFGKMKEPLLRVTALLRAFDAASATGRFNYTNPENALGQAALRSPTVFNFFEPSYVLPGPLAAAGLFAPECQILNQSTAISIPNQLRNFIYANAKPGDSALALKLDPLLPLAQSPDDLVNYFNLVFCAGTLTDHSRGIVVDALMRQPSGSSDLDRVRTALDLVITSPMAAVQR